MAEEVRKLRAQIAGIEHENAVKAGKYFRKADVWLSPIGIGFNTVRSERPDIDLFEPDAKHQSAAGSYLKCCINYLVLTGKPFTGEVATCGIDPDTAAYLREAAQRTVLGHEKEYRIRR